MRYRRPAAERVVRLAKGAGGADCRVAGRVGRYAGLVRLGTVAISKADEDRAGNLRTGQTRVDPANGADDARSTRRGHARVGRRRRSRTVGEHRRSTSWEWPPSDAWPRICSSTAVNGVWDETDHQRRLDQRFLHEEETSNANHGAAENRRCGPATPPRLPRTDAWLWGPFSRRLRRCSFPVLNDARETFRPAARKILESFGLVLCCVTERGKRIGVVSTSVSLSKEIERCVVE